MSTNPDPTPPAFALPLSNSSPGIYDADRQLVASAITTAKAAYLVRCANALPGLVAALEGRLSVIESLDDSLRELLDHLKATNRTELVEVVRRYRATLSEGHEAARAALKLAEAQP